MSATDLFPPGNSIGGRNAVEKGEKKRENRLEPIEDTLLLMIQSPPL
jgi:hypothetical protein